MNLAESAKAMLYERQTVILTIALREFKDKVYDCIENDIHQFTIGCNAGLSYYMEPCIPLMKGMVYETKQQFIIEVKKLGFEIESLDGYDNTIVFYIRLI